MEQTRLDQCLIGYDQGHRLLSASCDLPFDVEIELAGVSDFTAAPNLSSESLYLTGLPVENGSRYALIASWPAPELSRPGCVWAHALLIKAVDLAWLTDLRGLLTLFQRPVVGQGEARLSYSRPIILTEPSVALWGAATWSNHAERVGSYMLARLYGAPEKPVELLIDSNEMGEAYAALLAVWSQQWPRLRRHFRFCCRPENGVGSGRKYDVIIEASQLRNNFPIGRNVLNANEASVDWLRLAQADLDNGRASSFRTFLRFVAVDISVHRPAFRPLVSIFANLLDVNGCSEDDRLAEIGRVICKNFPTHKVGVALKSALLSQEDRKVLPAGVPSAMAILSVWIDVIPEAVAAIGPRLVARVVLENIDVMADPAKAWRFLAELLKLMPDIAKRVLPLVVNGLADDDVLDCVLKYPELSGDVLRERPYLLLNKRIWECVDIDALVAVALDLLSDDMIPDFLQIILGLPVDARSMIARRPSILKHILVKINEFDCEPAFSQRWITLLCEEDPCSTVEALVRMERAQRWLAAAICDRLGPRHWVVEAVSVASWCNLALTLVGTVPSHRKVTLAAHFFIIAIRRPEIGSEILIRESFDDLYDELGSYYVNEEVWATVEPDLPGRYSYYSWDKRRRLVRGVLEAYANFDISIDKLFMITRNADARREIKKNLRLEPDLYAKLWKRNRW